MSKLSFDYFHCNFLLIIHFSPSLTFNELGTSRFNVHILKAPGIWIYSLYESILRLSTLFEMKTCTVPQIGLRFDHLHLLLLQDEESSFYPICISYWNTLTGTVWLCDQQLPAQGIPRQFCYLLLQFDACNVQLSQSPAFQVTGNEDRTFHGCFRQ